MKPFLKKTLLLVIVLALLFISFSFYDRQFRLSNINSNFPSYEVIPISKENKEYLKNVFSQPFHYLDRGKQSYVFESQDKQYVVKFFDSRCRRSGMLPFFFTIKKERCAKKLKQLFNGLKVAESLGVESTGILFSQLTPDHSYILQAQLYDRFGFSHDIDLSTVPFVLQKKGIPLRILISDLLNRGKVEEASRLIQLVVDMYIKGYEKGIVDLDHNVMYNTGFVGSDPIRIDLGRLKFDERYKDPSYYQNDLYKVFNLRVGKWLENHYPKYKGMIHESNRGYLHVPNASRDKAK